MSAADVYRSGAPEETERMGERLAPAVAAGDVLLLSGPLGSGKTCFVRGLARGLRCGARVRSPSYAIVNEYRGRLLLVHLDLYRVEPGEIESLGLEEYLERAVLAAEWGEKLPAGWRRGALALGFAFGSAPDERCVSVGVDGSRGTELRLAWERMTPAATP